MTITEALNEYRFRNVGQFRGIAQSLGYKVFYNKEASTLEFKREQEITYMSNDKIREHISEPDLANEAISQKRICKFFDRDKVTLPEYAEVLAKEDLSIINWGDLKDDNKERFTVIDHQNKICYTGKELYKYANENNYLLDGKGTVLEEGILSGMTNIKGKAAKARLSENGITIFERKEILTIPDKILGKKLSSRQKQDLLDGNIIVLPTQKGDLMLQVDRDLNSVIVRSQRELAIPKEIGGYKLTPADKYLLANGHSLDNKVLNTEEGYIIANISMNEDKKGYTFNHIQMISKTKAEELMATKKPERDMDAELKDAVSRNDFEKVARLKEEGYTPSEETIRGLSQDNNLNQTQAIAIEKLFGIKPEIQNTEEVIQMGKDAGPEIREVAPEQELKEGISSEKDKAFIIAVNNEDFIKIAQLKEEGYKPSASIMEGLAETISENNMIAVQKIYGIQAASRKSLGDVKLANSHPDEKNIKQPLTNVINRAFNDM